MMEEKMMMHESGSLAPDMPKAMSAETPRQMTELPGA